VNDPIREAMERPEFFYSESAIPRRPQVAPDPIWGAGRLASASDVADCLSKSDDPGLVLPHVALLLEGANGLVLRPKERLCLSHDVLTRNVLVVGQDNRGRGELLLTPAIFGVLKASSEASIVVRSADRSLYQALCRWADEHRPDLDVRRVNFSCAARPAG